MRFSIGRQTLKKNSYLRQVSGRDRKRWTRETLSEISWYLFLRSRLRIERKAGSYIRQLWEKSVSRKDLMGNSIGQEVVISFAGEFQRDSSDWNELIPLVRIQSWREKFFHRCEIFVGIEWINIHFTLCIGSNAMGFFFLFNNIVVFQSFLILFNKIATRIAKTWRNLRKYNQQSRLFRSIWESIFHYVFTWSSNFLNYLNSSDFTSRNFTSTNTDLKSSYSTSSGLINLNES